MRDARLRDRDGASTNETPMLLEEPLDGTPGDLAVQVEVKATAILHWHGPPPPRRAG